MKVLWFDLTCCCLVESDLLKAEELWYWWFSLTINQTLVLFYFFPITSTMQQAKDLFIQSELTAFHSFRTSITDKMSWEETCCLWLSEDWSPWNTLKTRSGGEDLGAGGNHHEHFERHQTVYCTVATSQTNVAFRKNDASGLGFNENPSMRSGFWKSVFFSVFQLPKSNLAVNLMWY